MDVGWLVVGMMVGCWMVIAWLDGCWLDGCLLDGSWLGWLLSRLIVVLVCCAVLFTLYDDNPSATLLY